MKSLADRPFALVGVNSDKDPKVLAKKNAENGITWRSFWNGPAGTGGPISKQWNVSGWPTLYLLDHEGVIHKKWVGSPEEDVLDAEIEKLVELAEKAAKQDTGRAGARPFDEAVVAHA
ncbi:MAG: hypothetical protein KDB53_04935, partial [Planctomycetes bacterium]|nr:hypothetical protein [Planctomycetota bacterium]